MVAALTATDIPADPPRAVDDVSSSLRSRDAATARMLNADVSLLLSVVARPMTRTYLKREINRVAFANGRYALSQSITSAIRDEMERASHLNDVKRNLRL